jgi:choline kinase
MTRALILAAGQGTRLQPYTLDKPKCLVPLLGRPLLERQKSVLIQTGIHDIHVAAGYRADQIKALGFDISINDRFDSTNMVATLFSALPFIKQGGDLLIAYGDIVYQQDNLEKLLACDDEIALMIDSHWKKYWELRLDNPLQDAETLIMDKNGYITELGKKPDSYDRIQGQYTGLIKIRADKISEFIDFYNDLDRAGIYDGQNFDNMYMTSFLQAMINEGWKIRACLVENGWLEVDTVEDLELYENLAHTGQLQDFCQLE